MFVNLHCHIYSFLDSYGKPEKRIEWAKKNNVNVLCITDHGTLSGVYEFYKLCHQNKIKPIIGIEFYLVDNYSSDEIKKEKHHLVSLAKNKKGFELLCELNTIAWENFYYKPILSKEILFSYKEKLQNIIWTTACAQNDIAKNVINNNYEKAEQLLLEYDSILNNKEKTNFFLEIQPYFNINYKKVIDFYIKMNEKYGIKIMIGTDSHYTYPEESFNHKIFVLNSLKTKKTIFNETELFQSNNLYLYTEEQIIEEMKKMNIPENIIFEAIKNNSLISEQIHNFHIGHNEPQIPLPFSFNKDENLNKILVELCVKKLKELGLNNTEYKERLKKEIEIISENNYSKYFLLLYDIVNFIRNKYGKYIVSPAGRGSAGGSLVSYLLGITGVDPIKYELSFERFLNNYRAKRMIVKFFD